MYNNAAERKKPGQFEAKTSTRIVSQFVQMLLSNSVRKCSSHHIYKPNSSKQTFKFFFPKQVKSTLKRETDKKKTFGTIFYKIFQDN